jgi:hypothetical protein
VIPLATATVLVGITPGFAYPVLFWVTLLAVAWFGLRDGRETRPGPPGPLGAPERPLPA